MLQHGVAHSGGTGSSGPVISAGCTWADPSQRRTGPARRPPTATRAMRRKSPHDLEKPHLCGAPFGTTDGGTAISECCTCVHPCRRRRGSAQQPWTAAFAKRRRKPRAVTNASLSCRHRQRSGRLPSCFRWHRKCEPPPAEERLECICGNVAADEGVSVEGEVREEWTLCDVRCKHACFTVCRVPGLVGRRVLACLDRASCGQSCGQSAR